MPPFARALAHAAAAQLDGRGGLFTGIRHGCLLKMSKMLAEAATTGRRALDSRAARAAAGARSSPAAATAAAAAATPPARLRQRWP